MMLYLLIVLFGGTCSFFGPWWIIAPVCFIACFMVPQRPAVTFWIAAAAGATLWIGYAVYLHLGAEDTLTAKVMGIFTTGIPALAVLPATVLMLLIATCIVGVVSGFSGLAGVKIRQLVRPTNG